MNVSNDATLDERLTEVERRIAQARPAEPGMPSPS
jgi:hypothetical protein